MARTRSVRPDRPWRGSSRALAVLLLAVVVPPAATLVYLGGQLLRQDRSLFAQSEVERRAVAATTAAHALEASLAGVERGLAADAAVPSDVVRLTFSKTDVRAEPADRVSWVPAPRPMRAAASAPFGEAERLEYQGSAAESLSIYQQMTSARDAAVRAGALQRAARVLWQQRRSDEALGAYRQLADIRDVAIEGMPADLQARRAACGVLETSGRTAVLAREAQSLAADLVAGHWTLGRAAWELTTTDIERWTGHPLAIDADRGLLSSVADILWTERQRGAWPRPALSGRRLVGVDDTSVTVVWRTQGAQTTAIVIPPAVLQGWTAHAFDAAPNSGDRLSVVTPVGQLLAGVAPATDPAAVSKVAASDDGLPWTLVVSAGDSSPLSAEQAARRRLLSGGLVAILMFLGGGSYLLWRVVRRELAVVRQQQDFVSAVSHEFRTPLTSLRHVTELLQESDDVAPTKRHEFYDALGRSTERLHRLVESLLDFSRMEGGKKPYDLQPLDAGQLVDRVVSDFQQEVGPNGVTVQVDADTSSPMRVRADGAALTRAIWNLLDNAVKYSPNARAVHVSVARHPAGVAIGVRDEGIGIPARERSEVFGRFVRGEQASRLGIKGTGLGLAIVSRIVSAHGGTIELESEEGAGSTFRLVLPALD